MAELRNGGVTCRSTITFHSGSLRDGIHYMAEGEKGTEEREKQKKKDLEIGRYRQGEKHEKRK